MLTLLQRRRALRYLEVTQSNQYYPEMRARVHANFVKNKWWFHFQENRSLPFALHFSFFLFMAGVLIYFFNINHATFGAVAWWIAFTFVDHTVATVVPIFQRDELYYTSLFSYPFGLYLRSLNFVSRVCSWIKPGNCLDESIRRHSYNLGQHYSEGLVGSKAKWVEEAASKPSWGVDIEILDHILLVLDEDDELKRFFDAIPGFCNSELVKKPLHPWITTKLQRAMYEFLDRTFSSHLVPESVRNDRLITCLNAAHSALGPWECSVMLGNLFNGRKNAALKSVELGHSLSRWGHSHGDLISADLRRIIACTVVHARDRDDRWRILVQEVFGMPDGVFRDPLAHDDSVLLAILVHVAREDFRAGRWDPGVLESLSHFDVHNTIAEQRHGLCTLWNEIVREASIQGFGSIPTRILAAIRGHFAALHPGTDVASLQVRPTDLKRSSWYLLCNDSSHFPGSAAHDPAGTSSTGTPHTQLRSEHHSGPAIAVSMVQRPQSSHRLRRTHSCHQFPTSPPSEPNDALSSSPHIALASRLPLTASPDVATDNVTPDNADISGMSNTSDPIRRATSSRGSALQNAKETKATPPLVAFGPLLTPTQTPALGRSTDTVKLPPFMDSAMTRSNYITHTPGPPSPTSTPFPLSLAPQVTTISLADQYFGVHNRTASVQDNIQGSRSPIQKEVHDQSRPRDATASDIVTMSWHWQDR